MRRQLLAAAVLLACFTLVCGVAYPLLVTVVGRTAFADRADGSLIRRDGEVVGSALLGQAFAGPEWFHTRPSAAGEAGYDGRASAPSNLGPTNPALVDLVAERVVAYRADNGLAADVLVPVDAVTASGSGLDPHISVRNAELQTARVAAARRLDPDEVARLVAAHTTVPGLGFVGEEAVHVLRLNLALDELG